jgi:hypothetical protein
MILLLHMNQGKDEWWWSTLWKSKCLLKTRIFVCIVMENKVLTWDNGKKQVGRARIDVLCVSLKGNQ